MLLLLLPILLGSYKRILAHVIQVGLELSIFLEDWKAGIIAAHQYLWLQTAVVRRQPGVSATAQQLEICQTDRPSGPSLRVGTHIEEGEN